MSAIPWNHFHFIGYIIAVSLISSVALLDTIIFYCTTAGLLPIYVRSWRKKLCFYSVLMFTFGVALIAVGVLTLLENSTEKEIVNFLEISWDNLQDVEQNKVTNTQFWDNVQIQYTCCGLYSASNYNLNIPTSCCAATANACSIENAYKIGCANAVRRYFTHVLLPILVTVAFVTSGLCFISVLSAYCTFRYCCGLKLVNESDEDSDT